MGSKVCILNKKIMLLLLKLIALTSIWVLGLKIVTSEGMILSKWADYGKKKVEEGKLIFEPLIVCEWCMPSIHSLFGYGFAFALGILPVSWALLFIYPLVVMGSSIVAGLTWGSYKTMMAYADLVDAKTEFYDRFYEQQIEESMFDKEFNHN
jgi:hypothetical protein